MGDFLVRKANALGGGDLENGVRDGRRGAGREPGAMRAPEDAVDRQRDTPCLDLVGGVLRVVVGQRRRDAVNILGSEAFERPAELADIHYTYLRRVDTRSDGFAGDYRSVMLRTSPSRMSASDTSISLKSNVRMIVTRISVPPTMMSTRPGSRPGL